MGEPAVLRSDFSDLTSRIRLPVAATRNPRLLGFGFNLHPDLDVITQTLDQCEGSWRMK